MFQKSKSENSNSFPTAGPSGGASLIAAGTSLKGDLSSNGDIRIDGTLHGNIHCTAKVVIGANGIVQGDITGQQADIMGKITGTIKVKELLQLKGGCSVDGNIYAGKLQIEPSANFNGQCHMSNNDDSKAHSNGHSNLSKEKLASMLETEEAK